MNATPPTILDHWRDARVDPPAHGSRVLVLDGDGVRSLTWTDRSAVRWTWWLPREVLP